MNLKNTPVCGRHRHYRENSVSVEADRITRAMSRRSIALCSRRNRVQLYHDPKPALQPSQHEFWVALTLL